jgi:hypothetical protein
MHLLTPPLGAAIARRAYLLQPASRAPSLLGQHRTELVVAPGPQWDRMAVGFADASMMQSAAYMGRRWGAAKTVGLIVRERSGQRVLAATLAVVGKVPFLGAGIAYLKFGPLWRRRQRAATLADLQLALDAAKEEFAHRQGLLLRIMPRAEPDATVDWTGVLEAEGFVRQPLSADRESYFVNLQMSEAEMLDSLSAGWRRNLRKGQSFGLVVEELAAEEGERVFLGLYRDMLARKRFLDTHGIGALGALLAPGASPLRTKVLVARHEGETIAGAVLVGSGDVVSVPFSATSGRALELNAGYVLRWESMKLLRQAGARWLDLGGTEGNEGLRSFKTGNVGKRGVVKAIPGEFDYCVNPLSRLAAQGALAVRDWLRPRASSTKA